MKIPKLRKLAALLSFTSLPVFAQQASLETIEVVGHYNNAVGSSNAASQGSVSASLMADRPALRTAELLEFVPGMIVTQHSGDGKANQYFLRGFNLDHGTDFASYIDGMPINMRTHAHGQGYADMNFLIPELVQRIDYKKGPYFSEEGDFASAGAAHLRLFDSLPQGTASVTLGEHQYQRGVLTHAQPLASGNLLYGLELARNNGPWESPEQVRKASGMLRFSQGTKTDGFNMTAMVYRNKWNATEDIPARAVEQELISRFAAIDPTDGGNTARYSLSMAMHKRNNLGAFEMNAYAVKSNLTLWTNFTNQLVEPIDGDQIRQSEDRLLLGLNAQQHWDTVLSGLETQNKFGVQIRYDKLAPIGLYKTIQRNTIDTITDNKIKQASVGVYAENTTQWHEKLRSVTGLRWDSYQFKVRSNLAENSGTANANLISPKLSLIVGPWAKTEYFFNYGQGFHSNDARGTTNTLNPINGEALERVTPLVKSRGYEIGARTEIIAGLQSSIAWWQLDSASELVYAADAGTTEPGRASRRYGVEWSNHYIATPWLLFDFDIAASRARFTEYDDAGAYVPGGLEKVITFGATLNDQGAWSGALQLRYKGAGALIEDNSVRSASSLLTYARLGHKFNSQTRLTLDVFNVFNRKVNDIEYFYATRLANEPAEGIADRQFHPAEPRAVRLTLNYYF